MASFARDGQRLFCAPAPDFRFCCQTANAPPPLFFDRRGGRRYFLTPGNRAPGESSPAKVPRGRSAARRNRILSFRVPAKERGRLSALRRGFASRHLAETQTPGPRFSGTKLAASPSQRAPRGGVLVPLGRDPGPPGGGVTNPARGRRTHRSRFAGPGSKAGCRISGTPRLCCSIFEASREDALGQSKAGVM